MSISNPILSSDDTGNEGGSSPTVAFETHSDRPNASVDRVKSIEEDANVASVFSCFVNLCNTILGSGLLGLPYGNCLQLFIVYKLMHT